mmetsp:Transcript_31257/g.73674  ORF Transcript_31257/g.73674 Transcript_31257/m.73674 type:complete len:432 (-) Transcript_31257:81-1376(-)
MRSGTGDSMGMLIGINFLLGCGLLTPWNSLITAVDFFSALFPHMDPADAFAVANFAANLIFLLLQVVWVQKVSTVKASTCFVLYLGVLGFSLWLAIAFHAPFSDKDSGRSTESLHFMALVGSVAVAGAASSGLQSVLYSIAGEMGPTCIAAFMNGQAFAGLLTCICRILSKVGFAESDPFEALRLSSALYLSSSLLVVCLAFCGFFAIQRMRAERRAGGRDDPANKIEAESLIGGGADSDDDAAPAPELANFTEPDASTGSLSVWGRMWSSGVGVMFTFWVTLALFPGVTCRIAASQADPEEWMPVTLITVFNVGDLLGRMLAGACAGCFSEGALWLLNFLRLAFVPLLLYLQAGPDSAGGGWVHDAAAVLAVLAMAASSGFLACAFIIKGQLRVASSADREVASTLLALLMTLGLALGAVSALPLRKLVL